ncbi:MAG: 1-(5-phosphoribosyl)-5-[(5-phosphoribosylamino)methylideneamino] imidazole-4-carboxamide isomerase [Acidimicrobiia bacterium]|nr:1-(5-phosphoribosyl)-5-[(5-phosphoribosylamino)methylideneamino] imidazole-4-carboxamide isomerase [Acidimicrobiia bacterium]
MKVIPAVDVLDGKVVRLRQGRYDDVTVYAEDPAAMVASWVEQGADIVHVVDLAGARDGSGDRDLWANLGRTGQPFQLGGGIRTPEDADGLIAAGATRVVLGTAAVWEQGVVAAVVAALGTDAVVAAVDVRDGRATGAGWQDGGRDLRVVLVDLVEAGVSRVLATGIAGDGMLTGPDTALLDDVRTVAPELALIASGGVGTLDDIARVADMGVEAVIVGRALYDGRFTFAEAARVAAG